MTITQTIRHGAATVAVLTIAAVPSVVATTGAHAVTATPVGGELSPASCDTVRAAATPASSTRDVESLLAERHATMTATWFASLY